VPAEQFAKLVAQELRVVIAQEVRSQLRELLAEEFRVAEAAVAGRREPGALVDVHEIARITGMSERWAYDHAREIGGVKAGGTKRARWRFDPERALALLAERERDAPGESATKLERRELPSGEVELLPVRGRAA
jgi:hypothetical protein